MMSTQIKNRNKLVLLIAAIFIGISILFFTNSLVRDLKQEEQVKVKIWASATRETTKIENLENNMSFIFEVINNNRTSPVILTDENDNILYHKNLNQKKIKNKKYLQNQLARMKQKQDPIVYNYETGKSNKIYYGESILLIQLKYLPYVILLLVSLLILYGYIVFSISKKSEQNKVWVGMSREAAHQLGTPISSLMGWLTLLKSESSNFDLLNEINKDIDRLKVITERFSKIGSKPDLKKQNISKITEKSFYYMKARCSSKINFTISIPKDEVYCHINSQLFAWAIENIITNSIDAIEKNGKIYLKLFFKNNFIFIDIIDDGKGIKLSEFNKVFNPGYTTKNRGWGIGLSFVKRIIKEYHNGDVRVLESEINRGSTFRIKIPIS